MMLTQTLLAKYNLLRTRSAHCLCVHVSAARKASTIPKFEFIKMIDSCCEKKSTQQTRFSSSLNHIKPSLTILGGWWGVMVIDLFLERSQVLCYSWFIIGSILNESTRNIYKCVCTFHEKDSVEGSAFLWVVFIEFTISKIHFIQLFVEM